MGLCSLRFLLHAMEICNNQIHLHYAFFCSLVIETHSPFQLFPLLSRKDKPSARALLTVNRSHLLPVKKSLHAPAGRALLLHACIYKIAFLAPPFQHHKVYNIVQIYHTLPEEKASETDFPVTNRSLSSPHVISINIRPYARLRRYRTKTLQNHRPCSVPSCAAKRSESAYGTAGSEDLFISFFLFGVSLPNLQPTIHAFIALPVLHCTVLYMEGEVQGWISTYLHELGADWGERGVLQLIIVSKKPPRHTSPRISKCKGIARSTTLSILMPYIEICVIPTCQDIWREEPWTVSWCMYVRLCMYVASFLSRWSR